MSEERVLYHMHETTGQMSAIVKKFLDQTTLMPDEIRSLRWYVHQWVAAMPCPPADYDRIKIMSQQELKDYCFNVLLKRGIDPF